MNLKPWNEDIKHLREVILKEDKLEESKNLCLSLHSMVHSSNMSGVSVKTFEDELWEGLDEESCKTAVNEKGRTIVYGIWHSTRIEDITMNLLIAGGEQVLNIENWKDKINSKITDTGNALTKEEILEFSKNINIEKLKNYRAEVGKRTREIINNLISKDMIGVFAKYIFLKLRRTLYFSKYKVSSYTENLIFL
ncbi:hypothetical protein EDD66_11725 [Mobilisporobacter senegalensis]|uniref:DinB family protein n=1 Tax=Mobilisporobacter senegalensis TaxID=1329262 RepID=A0A3N1X5S8_9FIRM|nr:DinB family protein [Mobilisporobacter senegalensis]ROR22113.1 hypothetical protein EDD66_11725 [Mobilisporobacter senegalensis]